MIARGHGREPSSTLPRWRPAPPAEILVALDQLTLRQDNSRRFAMHSLRRRARLLARTLPLSAAIAVCCSYSIAQAATPQTTSASAALSGSWSGSYTGAYHGTFTLNWKQTKSRLKGTIKLSTEPAKLNVTGTVRSSTIRFGTVGSAAITYSGSVSGTSMSGKYTTPGGGGSWKAHLVRRA
jgi:hypothetical protein